MECRYCKIKPGSVHVDRKEEVLEIRKTRGGALLDVDDVIKTVLDDNDFVSAGQSRLQLTNREVLLLRR